MPAIGLLKWLGPYGIAAAVGFAAAWYWQGLLSDAELSSLKQEHAEQRQQMSDAAFNQIRKQVKLKNEQAEKISQLDEQYTREIRDAAKTIDELRADISSGKRGLYVDADCPGGVSGDSASTGMDNGGTRTRLNADTSERLIRLTERGDKAIRKLSACQDYVRTILSKRGTGNDN